MYCPQCKTNYPKMRFFKFNEIGYAIGYYNFCNFCRDKISDAKRKEILNR